VILGVTGHRPVALPGGGRMNYPVIESRMLRLATLCLESLPWGRPAEVISGMAEGWDMAVAEACVTLGIPLCAAVPFEGQERYWGGRSQQRYRALIAEAGRVEVVSTIRSKAAYLKRDEWIVDNSAAMLALCGKASGGTAYTVAYAHRWCVPVLNVWDRWVRYHQ
jgi:uncharacterized phage-like protein YoqJ